MKRMIVNSVTRETRVAILEDGELVDLFIERSPEHQLVGNIYKGRVANVLPGMQAAFVDIGMDRNAFLLLDDCDPRGSGTEDGDGGTGFAGQEIRECVREGEEILVQVSKEPFGSKGARVTQRLSLPGRFLVYMPQGNYVGISRRIADEGERARLKGIADRLRVPGEGIIVRTAAEGCGEKELARDLSFLRKLWERCKKESASLKAPAVVYRDLEFVQRAVRDFFAEDLDELWVDDRSAYRKIRRFLQEMMPQWSDRVKMYEDRRPIFEAFGIESEIEKLLRRKVWLKSGGYLVIDHTEALTVIDVNTGKYTGKANLEETALKTNLEAAKEIARQLRLRDIGGIIVIDFIDMVRESNREKVLRCLEAELAKDRTKTHVLGLTRLGLLEMTRKKVRQNLAESLMKLCPCCEGRGKVLSEDTVANRMERQIREYAGADRFDAILVEAHPQVNAAFIGAGGASLRRLEEETGLQIYLKGNDSFPPNSFAIVFAGTEEEVRRRAFPVREGEAVFVEIEGRHPRLPSVGIARVQGYVIHVEEAGTLVGERVLAKVEEIFRTYAKAQRISLPSLE
ncbi:Rne/Rng family ribonuclease [Bacillaceae bacterium]